MKYKQSIFLQMFFIIASACVLISAKPSDDLPHYEDYREQSREILLKNNAPEIFFEIYRGNTGNVIQMIEGGYDVNTIFIYSREDMLDFSIEMRNIKLIKYFMSKGLTPSSGKLYGLMRDSYYIDVERNLNDPKYMALKTEIETIVKLIVNNGCGQESCMLRSKIGTPLMFATKWGPDLCKYFVEHGADPLNRETEGTGWTAIHFAAEHANNVDTVKYLLSLGLKVNDLSNRSETPLHVAVYRERKDMVKFLLDQGAEPNIFTEFVTTHYRLPICLELSPLMIAINRGNLEIASILMDKGADPNLVNFHHQSPLTQAISIDNIDAIDLLLSRGADINGQGGHYPICVAVSRGNLDVIKFLVENSADLNIECERITGGDIGRGGKIELEKEYNSLVKIAREKGHEEVALYLEGLLKEQKQ